MKRLIYVLYLGLMLLILISCQKEDVMPANAAANVTSVSGAKTEVCPLYSYTSKTGTVILGSIRPGYVLIDFDDKVTPAQQLKLLNRYNIFDALEPEIYTDSGLLSVVRLKSQASCLDIEMLIKDLHTKPEVKLATPTFEPFAAQQGIFEWMGLTGEFIVEMKSPNSYHKLQDLALSTRTTIIGNLFGDYYLLLSDKNSTGTPLQVISYFNASNAINLAEPNYIFQYIPFKTGSPKPPVLQSYFKARLNTQTAL